MQSIEVRVYYEDTDLAGIVYYANYFKYIERGRTEFLRALGVDQSALKDEQGIVFAVRRVEGDYLKPAKMDDLLTVETSVGELQKARFTMLQEVKRGGELLFKASVTLVCLSSSGRPTRVPDFIRKLT